MRMRWLLTMVMVCATAVVSAVDRGERAVQSYGVIHGDVRDESGAVLPGVTVTVIDQRGVPRTAVTDEHGRFRFVGLEPGEYDIRAELAGFQPFVRRLTVASGSPSQVTVTLKVSSLQETVTVSAESPAINVSTSSVGHQRSGRRGRRELGSENRWVSRERYAHIQENPFHRVSSDPLSTFSIDVDTASYANVRRFLRDGELPPPGAVRVEELVNYFRFDYPEPTGATPFSVTTEVATCPWNPRHHLALIGLRGRAVPRGEAPARNLVFLVDVSGSMQDPDKLPLVQQGLRLLAERLTKDDRVAMVVYAGSSGLALPSTPGDRTDEILRAIDHLSAGGSTNGGEGIRLAYSVAREHFQSGGVNRVILATDGDFNVGVTSEDELVRLIERERKSGVFLSVLGVGTGNLQDATMEALADKGNGNYSYLDSLDEARRVLVHEADATIVTIAKDVKIQVEFNPRAVAGYRLVGYENRVLQHEDFNDDTKDAGEIGAGHTVTALYEIVPAGVEVPATKVDALKYQRDRTTARRGSADELLTVSLRYKAPAGETSRPLAVAMPARVSEAGPNLGFASAVAEFGLLLRDSAHAPTASFLAAGERARRHRGEDVDGRRAEFVELVERAERLHRLARR